MRKIRNRVIRFLHSKGRMNDIDGADSSAPDASVLDTLRAATILGKTAFGPRSGRDDPRLGQGTQIAGDFASSSRGKLCADLDGFSLHAAIRVDACSRDRLERLCRYAAHPPILHERLSLTDSGMMLYKFKKPWHDGSRHVVLTPLALIERLAALIPAPRIKLVDYPATQIPTRMETVLRREIPAIAGADHLVGLRVEFKAATASSLDYVVLVDLRGVAARDYDRLQRAISRVLVETCNEQGWVIPFTQVTVHQAAASA